MSKAIKWLTIAIVAIAILFIGSAILAGIRQANRTGYNAKAERKIDSAFAILRKQVASDISVELDSDYTKLYDRGGRFYYVCSVATLNRPGEGPLALNNERQRVVIVVNRELETGLATFDGRSDLEGQREFNGVWQRSCR